MTRIAKSLIALVLLLNLGSAAWAQDEAAAENDASGEANSVQVQQERIDQLITTLEDEQKREELIAQLRLLLEAEEQATPPDERPSVGDQLLGQLAQQFESLGDATDAILETPDDMLDLWNWLKADVTSTSGRSRWFDILRTLGISLGAGLFAFFLFAIPLRRLGRRIAQPSRTLWHKAFRSLLGLVIDALPVIAFAIAGSAALATMNAGIIAEAMTADLLTVINIALALCALFRVITRPRRPALRLVPVSDGVARSLTRRIYWVIGIMATAYGITETLPLIGMPWTARTAFLTIASLAVGIILIGTVIKHRRPVQYAIERSVTKGTIVGDLFIWLGRNWHAIGVGVILILVVTYIVGGDLLFLGVVGKIGWTLLILLVSVAIWQLIDALLTRQAARRKAEASDGDAIRETSQALVRIVVKLALTFLAAALLVHIWIFDVLDWLGNDTGQSLIEGGVTIAIIIGLAYAANRIIAAIIDRIQHSRRSGSLEQRRRRVETLLPLLRSTAAVLIVTVTSLIVLSEIGLDITPLLASAGVIGLAIGFGAQSLVKDVITGLFILLEDAVGVGDVVTVGGYTGVVEEMSIRTIRLRDFSGSVHVVPFGVVDAATNMTRDFSFAVFEIGVSYDSDVDEVMAIMAEVDTEMRDDIDLRRLVLEPIQIVGLDSFGDSAVVIKARIKTRPGEQWTVLRAYNRLLKKRFDERGIEIPFPQMSLHVPDTVIVDPAPMPGNKPVESPDSTEPAEPIEVDKTPKLGEPMDD